MKNSRIIKREKKPLELKEVLKIFEDCATIHGETLGVGYDVMKNNDQFWALLRTKFVVIDNKEVTDVVATTYPKPQGRIDFDREYIISENDSVLIEGISKWVIVSMSNRNLKRNHGILIENCVSDSIFNSVNKIDFNEDDFKLIDTYEIQDTDIDVNNHVNNTNYANIIKMVYNVNNIKEFQIDYLNEILAGSNVSVYQYINDSTYILGRCDEVNCFIAKIKER